VNLIRVVIKEYCDQHQNDGLTPDLYWKMLKMEFRRRSIAYSARKKREQLKEQHILEEEITILENKVQKTEQEYDRLQHCKNLIQIMYNNKVKGSIIRSRILGYEQGDRPSSYFLNLEKSNQAKKSI
jgi:hypothetical protein